MRCVKQTQQKLQDGGNKDANETLISFDVKALFPNTPVKQAQSIRYIQQSNSEAGANESLPFLDLRIINSNGKLEVYRKPADNNSNSSTYQSVENARV